MREPHSQVCCGSPVTGVNGADQTSAQSLADMWDMQPCGEGRRRLRWRGSVRGSPGECRAPRGRMMCVSPRRPPPALRRQSPGPGSPNRDGRLGHRPAPHEASVTYRTLARHRQPAPTDQQADRAGDWSHQRCLRLRGASRGQTDTLERLRVDRQLEEALVHGPDPLHLAEVFGLAEGTAIRYAESARELLGGTDEQQRLLARSDGAPALDAQELSNIALGARTLNVTPPTTLPVTLSP